LFFAYTPDGIQTLNETREWRFAKFIFETFFFIFFSSSDRREFSEKNESRMSFVRQSFFEERIFHFRDRERGRKQLSGLRHVLLFWRDGN
jgi:hypothetical protein